MARKELPNTFDKAEIVGKQNPDKIAWHGSLLQSYGITWDGNAPDGYVWVRMTGYFGPRVAETIAIYLSDCPVLLWHGKGKQRHGFVRVEFPMKSRSKDVTLREIRKTTLRVLEDWPAALEDRSLPRYRPPVTYIRS